MQLRKAGRVVTQIYDRCLRPVGIRGTQFALLKRIACMRRPFITDIGKVLCMDQTTATRNIGLLERAGFVAVGVHPDDARKKVVELTPEGQAKLEEAFPCGKRPNGKSGNTSATTGWGICAPCFRF